MEENIADFFIIRKATSCFESNVVELILTMSTSEAMDVVRCAVCKGRKTKLPAINICKTCNLELCEQCITVHLTHSDQTNGHNILDIRYRHSESVANSVICEKHKQDCVMYCNLCHIPVCTKCLELRVHGNHELVQILRAVQSIKEKLTMDNKELEECFTPAYERVISRLKYGLSSQKECHKQNRDYIERQGRRFHKELEEIIETELNEARENEKRDTETFGNLISDMEGILLKIKQLINDNREIHEEMNISNFFKHKNNNEKEKFRVIPRTFEITAPSFSPGRIDKQRLQQMFGALTKSIKRTKSPQKITSTITTYQDKEHLKAPEVTRLWHTGAEMNVSPKVCCLNKSRNCFVRSGSHIKCFNETGENVSVHKLKSHFLIDITVSKDNHLIYSDYREKRINMIKDDAINTIVQLKDWKPLAVCCCFNDDLLVTMQSDDETESKVCRYSGGSFKHEIQYGDDKSPLYSNPLFICENTNLDICVSDFERNAVVVVDPSGGFLFNYTGGKAFENNEYKFRPRGLACDSLKHILVSDDLNSTVHIINHNGHFLQFIDNCGLQSPQDLSISDNDELYVVVNHEDILKVISYLA